MNRSICIVLIYCEDKLTHFYIKEHLEAFSSYSFIPFYDDTNIQCFVLFFLYKSLPNTEWTNLLDQDNLRYTDNDIIAIFEDDADIAIPDIHQALIQEFKEMNTDLLFLGYCCVACYFY